LENFSQKIAHRELQIAAATATGPHHLKRNEANQDSFAVFDHVSGEDAVLGVAVADGAGSLPRSGDGATIAAEIAAAHGVDLVLEARSHGTPVDLRSIALEAIMEARTSIFKLDYWREAGSTLVVALVAPEGFVVATLGDSFAVLELTDGGLELIQPPSVGEFANITKLLTSDSFSLAMASGPLEDFSAVGLCSDGLENSTLQQSPEGPLPVRGFWGNIFSMASKGTLAVASLIEFMDRQGKIEDDTTLATVKAVDSERHSGEITTRFELLEFADGRFLQGEETAALPDMEEPSKDSWKDQWDGLDSSPSLRG